jgi:hypothetical protein
MSVEVHTDEPIKLAYRRKSKDCPKEAELESFDKSTSFPVPSLWVPDEEFRLLLDWDNSNTLDPGLLVLSLDRNHKDRPVFWLDPPNSRRVMYFDEYDRPQELKSGESLPLPVENVVNILAKQRSALNGNNSGKARNSDDERLKGKLNTLTLAVK